MRGITFGNKHTFRDWGLILKEKPDINFPEVKTNYIDISGTDGHIDLTEALTGEPKYKNRDGSLVFSKVGDRNRWEFLKSSIADFLHGKRMQMITDDDHSYYYLGRFSLNEWKSDKKIGQITIDYSLEPYKYELFSSIEEWEWDPFNFETGVIRNYKELPITPDARITLIGSRKSVIPTITVDSDDGHGFYVYGEYGIGGSEQWFFLPDGIYKDPNFIIRQGEHEFLFAENTEESISGSGKITVDFKGGRL